MKTELIVSEPVALGGRLYQRGEPVDPAHESEAQTFHPNHFRRRFISELTPNQDLASEEQN